MVDVGSKFSFLSLWVYVNLFIKMYATYCKHKAMVFKQFDLMEVSLTTHGDRHVAWASQNFILAIRTLEKR